MLGLEITIQLRDYITLLILLIGMLLVLLIGLWMVMVVMEEYNLEIIMEVRSEVMFTSTVVTMLVF